MTVFRRLVPFYTPSPSTVVRGRGLTSSGGLEWLCPPSVSLLLIPRQLSARMPNASGCRIYNCIQFSYIA